MPIEKAYFVPNPAGMKELRQSANGPVGSDMRKRMNRLVLLSKASVPKRTGALAASITGNFYTGVKDCFFTVGSKLKYAYYVHEGTKPHVMKTAPGRVLRFVNNGRVVYAHKAMHPGTKPDRYLSKHLRSIVR